MDDVMVLHIKDPVFSTSLWFFKSPRGARSAFKTSGPYVVCEELKGGYYGIAEKRHPHSNILKRGILTGVTTKKIAQEIARKWNG
jgi:hypothetical protein